MILGSRDSRSFRMDQEELEHQVEEALPVEEEAAVAAEAMEEPVATHLETCQAR